MYVCVYGCKTIKNAGLNILSVVVIAIVRNFFHIIVIIFCIFSFCVLFLRLPFAWLDKAANWRARIEIKQATK